MTESNITNSKLNTGPTGRAVSQPMEADILEALYHHLTMERKASAQYFAISLWFLERELRGFSKFFKEESLSEQDHASTFANYLIARGQKVDLYDIPAPNQSWKSFEEIIGFSFQMESDVTTSLQQIYSMAERSGDTRTNVFLDPVIDNQIKSEDDFAHLLGRVRFAANQPSAILIIDNDLAAKV